MLLRLKTFLTFCYGEKIQTNNNRISDRVFGLFYEHGLVLTGSIIPLNRLYGVLYSVDFGERIQ